MKTLSLFWNFYSVKILIILVLIIFSMSFFFLMMKKNKKNYFKSLLNEFNNIPHKYPQAFRKEIKLKWTGDSKGEIQCRNFLEKKFNRKFPKCRPHFLKNPITNGALMELDCFNEELSLACEYQGEQHYKFIPHFHKTYDSFLNQKYRDKLKKEICARNKVYLIVVPYYKDIDTYLEKSVEKWINKKRKLNNQNEWEKKRK